MAADRLGFAHGILAGDGALDAVLAATDGEGFDVVFDATGFGGSMEKSFAFVAHGGAWSSSASSRTTSAFPIPNSTSAK